MLKRILISLLSVLIILILVTGVFRYFVGVCDDYLLHEAGFVDEEAVKDGLNRTVDYVFTLETPVGEFEAKRAVEKKGDSISVVIGRALKDRRYYYNVFNTEGRIIAKGKFGKDINLCKIHDIRVAAQGVYILCEYGEDICLYLIDVLNYKQGGGLKVKEILDFIPDVADDKILKLLLPDNAGNHIVVACAQSAVLYSLKGEPLKKYNYSPKSIITSGVYSKDKLVLCGANSVSEDGVGFSYGFAEAYGADCELLWSKRVYDESNCISAVMECQINNDGQLALYGRFYDYNKSDVVMTTLDVSRIEEFKMHGHGNRYYVYTDKKINDDGASVQASAFLATLDESGNEKEMQVYSALNDYKVPSISKEHSLNKLNNNGEFLLTSAQATASSDGSYFLTINGESVEIPSNVHVVFDVDCSGGVFTYLAENSSGVYKMKYYTDVKAFSKAMNELRRALKISEILDFVPTLLPWILMSAVSIILLIAKHKWRNIDGE